MKSTTTSSREYDDWHRAMQGASNVADPRAVQWHVDALKIAPPLAGKAVLEVGCGQGNFAIHLAEMAGSVTAVDFSAAAVAIAQAKGEARQASVKFSVADAQALPFPAGGFDVVFSCECLEHLPDPQQGVREMARVLKPGGVLVLTTENYSNAMVIYWAQAWLTRRPFNSGSGVQPIEQFFLFWQVRRMMRAAGLKVTRMIGAHHVFLVIPGCHPHLFVRERIRSSFWAWLLRPAARHISFRAVKA